METPGKAEACDPGDPVVIPRVLSVCSRNVSAVPRIREFYVLYELSLFPLFLFLIKSIYLWCWDTEVAPHLSVLVLVLGHDRVVARR